MKTPFLFALLALASCASSPSLRHPSSDAALDLKDGCFFVAKEVRIEPSFGTTAYAKQDPKDENTVRPAYFGRIETDSERFSKSDTVSDCLPNETASVRYGFSRGQFYRLSYMDHQCESKVQKEDFIEISFHLAGDPIRPDVREYSMSPDIINVLSLPNWWPGEKSHSYSRPDEARTSGDAPRAVPMAQDDPRLRVKFCPTDRFPSLVRDWGTAAAPEVLTESSGSRWAVAKSELYNEKGKLVGRAIYASPADSDALVTVSSSTLAQASLKAASIPPFPIDASGRFVFGPAGKDYPTNFTSAYSGDDIRKKLFYAPDVGDHAAEPLFLLNVRAYRLDDEAELQKCHGDHQKRTQFSVLGRVLKICENAYGKVGSDDYSVDYSTYNEFSNGLTYAGLFADVRTIKDRYAGRWVKKTTLLKFMALDEIFPTRAPSSNLAHFK